MNQVVIEDDLARAARARGDDPQAELDAAWSHGRTLDKVCRAEQVDPTQWDPATGVALVPGI